MCTHASLAVAHRIYETYVFDSIVDIFVGTRHIAPLCDREGSYCSIVFFSSPPRCLSFFFIIITFLILLFSKTVAEAFLQFDNYSRITKSTLLIAWTRTRFNSSLCVSPSVGVTLVFVSLLVSV